MHGHFFSHKQIEKDAFRVSNTQNIFLNTSVTFKEDFLLLKLVVY